MTFSDPGLETEALDPASFGDESVPSFATGLDDGGLAWPDAEREEAFPQEQPDAFDRVEFRCVWRQANEGDVVGDGQSLSGVPSRTIDYHQGVFVGGQSFGEFGQEQIHGLGGDFGQDEGEGVACRGLGRCEDIGPVEAMGAEAGRALALEPPAMAQPPFLPDAGLVREDFHGNCR